MHLEQPQAPEDADSKSITDLVLLPHPLAVTFAVVTNMNQTAVLCVQGAAQGINEADFLHLLSDCCLFTNK